jgi:hypothetical protein
VLLEARGAHTHAVQLLVLMTSLPANADSPPIISRMGARTDG